MTKKMKKKLIFILVALVLFVGALLCPAVLQEELPILQTMLFVLAYLLVGFEVLKKAFCNLLKGHVFDENFLMSVATLGAFGIGELEEAVAVMLFYQVGEFFQSYAVDKSRKSVAALMDIRPDYANVYRNGEIVKVNPDDVNIGELILVKPGEKVPLDCTVVAGDGMLNTLALTGEATPRHVGENDSVLSGSISIDGTLKLKVDKEFGESTVSKILELVENASSRKSKSENFISKFARYYTPIVVGIAVLLAFVPPLFLGWNTFSTWIYRALSFLVVSCPCALVISIPLSFFAGIGASAKCGILIKGSNYLEALSKTKMIVCDKTGTLTEGKPKVSEVYWTEQENLEQYMSVLLFLERQSEHPLAEAVVSWLQEQGVNGNLQGNFESVTGMGVEGQVDGKKFCVGNMPLLESHGISCHADIQKRVEAWTKEGKTVVYFASGQRILALIAIADSIKKGAVEAIRHLQNRGIQVYMLTGDHRLTANAVARKAGITNFKAEVMPGDKAAFVEGLQKEGKVVAMVGDGINDSQALVQADVSIAMGKGADIAMDVAKITLITSDLNAIPKALSLSRQTVMAIRQNLFWAFIYNLMGIPIAAGILYPCCGFLLNPMIAALAMAFSSVSVVSNSLRIKRKKLNE